MTGPKIENPEECNKQIPFGDAYFCPHACPSEPDCRYYGKKDEAVREKDDYVQLMDSVTHERTWNRPCYHPSPNGGNGKEKEPAISKPSKEYA